MSSEDNGGTRRVSLFVPCLVDQIFPEIGLSMADVLEGLGFEIEYDPRQTCCGQPAFNAGHVREAREVAECLLDVFAGAETIVSPSGSCAAMTRVFYPDLFAGRARAEDARRLGSRIFEFSEFLLREGAIERLQGRFEGKVAFHNSCHSYRELGLSDEAYRVLSRIDGCDIVRPGEEPVCCGFGGLFSIKFEAISSAMACSRLDFYRGLGVDVLVSNDPGCVMKLREESARSGLELEILHLAEFVAQSMKRCAEASS